MCKWMTCQRERRLQKSGRAALMLGYQSSWRLTVGSQRSGVKRHKRSTGCPVSHHRDCERRAVTECLRAEWCLYTGRTTQFPMSWKVQLISPCYAYDTVSSPSGLGDRMGRWALSRDVREAAVSKSHICHHRVDPVGASPSVWAHFCTSSAWAASIL